MSRFNPHVHRVALSLLPVLLSTVAARAATCDVRTFGARGDGVTKDTAAIQKAIDTCATGAGSRTVRLAGGVFVTAPLLLKSHLTLEIEPGTTLLGSPDHADYKQVTDLGAPGRQPLLGSEGASDITVTGGGTIDGNGASWWAEARSQKDHGVVGEQVFRPRLIVLSHSHHIRLENLTIQNSPSWQVVPYYCDDVVLRSLKILADPHSPNTDAIDPFSSSNVTIDHVTADVGDDNVAIKSGLINSPGPDAPAQNITITDCVFLHGHGLSIGSEIAGGAKHIEARNIQFKGTDNGIRIKANRDRGADVSDVRIRNVEMQDVGTAILISEYYPKVLPPDDAQAAPVTRLTPVFHDIVIENLSSKGGKVAGVIAGLPESPVRDVTLRNVSLEARTGMHISFAAAALDHVSIHVSSGEPVMVAPSAKVSVKP